MPIGRKTLCRCLQPSNVSLGAGTFLPKPCERYPPNEERFWRGTPFKSITNQEPKDERGATLSKSMATAGSMEANGPLGPVSLSPWQRLPTRHDERLGWVDFGPGLWRRKRTLAFRPKSGRSAVRPQCAAQADRVPARGDRDKNFGSAGDYDRERPREQGAGLQVRLSIGEMGELLDLDMLD